MTQDSSPRLQPLLVLTQVCHTMTPHYSFNHICVQWMQCRLHSDVHKLTGYKKGQQGCCCCMQQGKQAESANCCTAVRQHDLLWSATVGGHCLVALLHVATASLLSHLFCAVTSFTSLRGHRPQCQVQKSKGTW